MTLRPLRGCDGLDLSQSEKGECGHRVCSSCAPFFVFQPLISPSIDSGMLLRYFLVYSFDACRVFGAIELI